MSAHPTRRTFPRSAVPFRSMLLGGLLALLSLPVLRAESGLEGLVCRHGSHGLLAADADAPANGRHYAPDRTVDIGHVAIDITPDFESRTLRATTTLRAHPVARPLEQLTLDAVDLRIDRVESSAPMAGWTYDDRRLVLTFSPPVALGTEVTVTVAYGASPRQGLYFRTPAQGYRPGDTHLWTQGEPVEARHWFPCFDAPNDRFTSEVTCRLPDGMKALSNGRLVRRERDPATGLTAFHWLQDTPHVAYLVCLVAGHLETLEDRHRDIPLAFHTPPSRITTATNSFRGTAGMMAFFEEELGVPYPWAKYDQVVVDDFTAGGMENTSLTTLTHRTLHTDDFGTTRSSRGLVAHELAHQWFGDLVTCKDWAHLWLNEGFATYYDALQARHALGEDDFRHEMLGNLRAVLGARDDRTPIVWRRYGNPMEQFGYRAYPKGSWILHMLRHQLGGDLYRRCIRTYLERHAGQSVVTADLVRVIEDVSGRSWDKFFDQYVYHARHPDLKVDYAWDEPNRQARITVAQTHEVNDQVLLFDVPLTVRFEVAGRTVDRVLRVHQKQEDFHIALPGQPETVRVDPDLALLADIRFEPPRAMLPRLLAATNDMVGRLRAVETLGRRTDDEAIRQIGRVLREDPFHGVRRAAAKALQEAGSDVALGELMDSRVQSDDRVRLAVWNGIARFYRPSVRDALVEALASESHPEIAAALLRGLGTHPGDTVRGRLEAELDGTSHDDIRARAALTALRTHADPAAAAAVRGAVDRHRAAWVTETLASALETAGALDSEADDRSATRELLLAHVNHPKRAVRIAAIRGLGALGDAGAVGPLQAVAAATQGEPGVDEAARKAVATIRDGRPPFADLGVLRQEVVGLQKDNQELRESLEKLRRQWEAGEGAEASGPAATGKPARRPWFRRKAD